MNKLKKLQLKYKRTVFNTNRRCCVLLIYITNYFCDIINNVVYLFIKPAACRSPEVDITLFLSKPLTSVSTPYIISFKQYYYWIILRYCRYIQKEPGLAEVISFLVGLVGGPLYCSILFLLRGTLPQIYIILFLHKIMILNNDKYYLALSKYINMKWKS
jgi:hypothetical protein